MMSFFVAQGDMEDAHDEVNNHDHDPNVQVRDLVRVEVDTHAASENIGEGGDVPEGELV